MNDHTSRRTSFFRAFPANGTNSVFMIAGPFHAGEYVEKVTITHCNIGASGDPRTLSFNITEKNTSPPFDFTDYSNLENSILHNIGTDREQPRLSFISDGTVQWMQPFTFDINLNHKIVTDGTYLLAYFTTEVDVGGGAHILVSYKLGR